MSQTVLARPLFKSLLDHAEYLIDKKELDAAEGFQDGLLTHIILLKPSGRAKGWVSPSYETKIRGKVTNRRGLQVKLPTTPRSSGIKARLGWDDHRYVYEAGPHRDAFAQRIEAIRTRVEEAGKSVPLLDAVHSFYENGHVDAFLKKHGGELAADFEALKAERVGENSDRFSFALADDEDMTTLVEVDELKEFLSEHLYQDDLPTGKCIITGKEGPLLRSSGLIKGVRGAQASGARLISFTTPVALSFGLTRDLAYPPYHVSVDSAIRALNHIMTRGRTKIATDSLTVCHYTDGNRVFADEILQPYPVARDDKSSDEDDESDRPKLEELLYSPKNGRVVVDLDARVTTIGLRPSGGRVALTLYDDSSTETLLKRIKRWHDDLYIPRFDEAKYGRRPFPIFMIVGALEGYIKGKGSQHPLAPAQKADLVQQLYVSAVFENEPLPTDLQQYLFAAASRLGAVQRVAGRHQVDDQRHMLAMISKLILIRQHGRTDVTPDLEISDSEGSASCLGRMYALLVIIHEMTYPERPGLLSSQMQSVIAHPRSFDGSKFFSLVRGRKRSSIPIERGIAYKAEKRWSMITPHTSGLPSRFTPAQRHEFLVGFEKERQLFRIPNPNKRETEEEKSYAEA